MPRKRIDNEWPSLVNFVKCAQRVVFALWGCFTEFKRVEARCQFDRGINSVADA